MMQLTDKEAVDIRLKVIDVVGKLFDGHGVTHDSIIKACNVFENYVLGENAHIAPAIIRPAE